MPGKVAKYLAKFEAMLEKGGGHIVLSGLSTADVLLAEMAHELESFCPGSLGNYPKLRNLRDEVVGIPGVTAYLKSPLRFPLPVGKVREAYVTNVMTVLAR